MFDRFPYMEDISNPECIKLINRVRVQVMPEKSNYEFYHIFTLSEAIERQTESQLPAEAILKKMVQPYEVKSLLKCYKKHRLIDKAGQFTSFAKEFNIYCLFPLEQC